MEIGSKSGRERTVYRKVVLTSVVVALLGLAALWQSGAFYLLRSNDAYGLGLDLLKAYESRNAAAIYFLQNVQRDQATASKISGLANEARRLGGSLKAELAMAVPFPSARKTFQRFMELQCTIAREITDEKFRRTPAWTQVQPRLQKYNLASQNSLDVLERFFGSNRIVFVDC